MWLAKQGLFIGFGGACTFKGAKRAAKAISALPLESIVLETDCPYMAPEPVRGTRCDSSLIRYVGEYIAQLRGISAEEVFRTTAEKCPPGIRAVISFFASCTGFSLCFCINQQSKSKLL